MLGRVEKLNGILDLVYAVASRIATVIGLTIYFNWAGTNKEWPVMLIDKNITPAPELGNA